MEKTDARIQLENPVEVSEMDDQVVNGSVLLKWIPT
jgi:hypothetical protein